MEIKVPNPIELDGGLITSITLRPPTREDYVAASRPAVGRYMLGLRVLSRLTGLPTRTVSAILSSNDDVADRVEKYVLACLD